MRLNYFLKNFKYPKKSFLGRRLLSSVESSISAYFIFLAILLLTPYFGNEKREIISAKLFNIIAYSSLLILILNIYLTRNEIKKTIFLILNIPLFFNLPSFVFYLIKNIFFY